MCKIFIMCTELFVRGVVKQAGWVVPSQHQLCTGEGDCSLTLKRWPEATLHLHNIYTREMQGWHPIGAQCYVSLPEEQEQKEESSNSSTFINLLAINERLVREMSAIVFFLKKKKKKKEIQLDYMGLPGMYNRREPQCKSSAGNRTQFIFGNT